MLFRSSSGGAEWMIVFLGNAGPRYTGTRHNVGFAVGDILAKRCGVSINRLRSRALTARTSIGGHEVLLVKPQTFMNLSGEAVRPLSDYCSIVWIFIRMRLLRFMRFRSIICSFVRCRKGKKRWKRLWRMRRITTGIVRDWHLCISNRTNWIRLSPCWNRWWYVFLPSRTRFSTFWTCMADKKSMMKSSLL